MRCLIVIIRTVGPGRHSQGLKKLEFRCLEESELRIGVICTAQLTLTGCLVDFTMRFSGHSYHAFFPPWSWAH